MGQFATPSPLARDMLTCASRLLARSVDIRFLYPALGSGTFYSALIETFDRRRIVKSVGYEIDSLYATAAKGLWGAFPLEIHVEDFTEGQPPQSEDDRFNLIVCNPPYVRHHHLSTSTKDRLTEAVRIRSGIKTNGLSGLYCYFLLLCHGWLSKNGIGLWLIPSEFMDVNYGRAMKEYLLDSVTLLRIHRFGARSVQFEDALVSSAIVILKKKKPTRNHVVRFTYGASLLCPERSVSVERPLLATKPKWTTLSLKGPRKAKNSPTIADFFTVKRGLATGANSFFILSEQEIQKRNLPRCFFRPILPSPRFLESDELEADAFGNPIIEKRLFLLDCGIPVADLKVRYPSLYKYLESGKPGVAKGYLCQRRKPWYAQESREPSPFLCTYMGRKDTKRGRPFRFILNHSRATATNVYLLLYPRRIVSSAMAKDPDLARKMLAVLNNLHLDDLLREGRFYGGGLHKLEPRELGRVPALGLVPLVPGFRATRADQMELFAAPAR